MVKRAWKEGKFGTGEPQSGVVDVGCGFNKDGLDIFLCRWQWSWLLPIKSADHILD
jgi:hypothetical protein